MTDITPPPELVQQWMNDIYNDPHGDPHFVSSDDRALAARAAQWGADQELDACCDWMSECTVGCTNELRAARRPKPPSLKKQAIKAAHIELDPQGKNGSLIIRALEALPDD